MEKTIQALLGKIGELQKRQLFKQAEISKRGENFNVFNVLGLWSEEVRLHSAMLAELLNPEGSHGCDDAFLVAFIRDLLGFNLANSQSCIGKAVITTEYNIGSISHDGMKGGRIDILVEMPEGSNIPSLIIENKIYAGDQSNQLRRYYNFGLDYFHSSDKFKILYLTIYGNNPSFSSIGESDVFYKNISYAKDISRWLSRCASIAYDKPKVRETIIQYNHLINQITTYNMEDKNEMVEEIASNHEYLKNALLICSKQNEITKKAIMGPITDVLKQIRGVAESELKTKNTSLNIEFKPDDDFGEKGGKIDWGFSYLIKDEKSNHTVSLKYIFDKWGLNDLWYGISQQDTSRDISSEQPIFNNKNETWIWGWEWMPDRYRNWNGKDLYNLINDLTDETKKADFYNCIINSIKKASELF